MFIMFCSVPQYSSSLILQDKGQGALGGAIGMLKTIYNNLQTLYHCVVIALTEAPAIFIVTV